MRQFAGQEIFIQRRPPYYECIVCVGLEQQESFRSFSFSIITNTSTPQYPKSIIIMPLAGPGVPLIFTSNALRAISAIASKYHMPT